MRRSLVIYDFAPDPSEFHNIWEKFSFIFYQCVLLHIFDFWLWLTQRRRAWVELWVPSSTPRSRTTADRDVGSVGGAPFSRPSQQRERGGLRGGWGMAKTLTRGSGPFVQKRVGGEGGDQYRHIAYLGKMRWFISLWARVHFHLVYNIKLQNMEEHQLLVGSKYSMQKHVMYSSCE
jgi:hypothetical protein